MKSEICCLDLIARGQHSGRLAIGSQRSIFSLISSYFKLQDLKIRTSLKLPSFQPDPPPKSHAVYPLLAGSRMFITLFCLGRGGVHLCVRRPLNIPYRECHYVLWWSLLSSGSLGKMCVSSKTEVSRTVQYPHFTQNRGSVN